MDKRFEYGSATAILAIFSDEPAAVLSNVFSRDRGRGHATGLLNDIVSYADEHKLTIFLTAQQYGHPVDGLNNRELIKFYSKFGFEKDPRFTRPPIRMIRYYKEASCPRSDTTP